MPRVYATTTAWGELLPQDAHNAALLANAHPADWANPQPAARYDLVVIGAGTAGLTAAADATSLGVKVALVERHLLGGNTVSLGSVPSKCLIAAARIAACIHAAPAFGVRAGAPEIDFAAVMERARRLRARISQRSALQRFKELGADVFLGNARFTAPDRVAVNGKTLRFQRAIVATGARPVHPPIDGLAEAGFLTNETVFSLTERPSRLAVVGGGPVGCELAQAFHRLGSAVTIVETGSQLLPREDRDAAVLLTAVFKRDGVAVRLNTRPKRVEVSDAQKLLHLERGSTQETLAADDILVGVGRAPNAEGLGLEAAGIRHSFHGIHTNDYLQTTNPNIYAAGDVCTPWGYTHTAEASARIVIQNALLHGRKKLSALTLPWCTHTDPEIAHVGITVQDAATRGIALETFLIYLRDVDRAIVEGQEDGFVKIHVKKGTDCILGATIVARHAGEMINEITLAMVARIGLGKLAGVIHPYPTQAEAIRKAAEVYKRTRPTPLGKRLVERWLRWAR